MLTRPTLRPGALVGTLTLFVTAMLTTVSPPAWSGVPSSTR